jgi:uncharacterized membrane protein YkoI
MKKLFLSLLLAAAIVPAAMAQQKEKVKLNPNDVPQAVKTAFQNAYSNASDVEWKMMGANYKVRFEINDKDHLAEIDPSGTIVATGMKITNSELPAAVTSAVQTGYANSKIDEAYRIEKGGTSYYMVKLDGKPDRKVVYSADGRVVKDKTK